VYQYDVKQGESNLGRTYDHRAPVLDVCFGSNDSEAFTAGMDWAVNRCG
jgi:cell cycle arrest protein BUB3